MGTWVAGRYEVECALVGGGCLVVSYDPLLRLFVGEVFGLDGFAVGEAVESGGIAALEAGLAGGDVQVPAQLVAELARVAEGSQVAVAL